jgi:hypothetical protein
MNGYISETMYAGRGVSHGKITDLTTGFSLGDDHPFSIYVRPKGQEQQTDNIDTILPVRTYAQEKGYVADAPFAFYTWSPLSMVYIAPQEGDLLDNIEIYWCSGSKIDSL